MKLSEIRDILKGKVIFGDDKLDTDSENQALRSVLEDVEDLPFLAVESDGSTFPQLINAKIEAFCLRDARLHQRMLKVYNPQQRSLGPAPINQNP